jgi:hypothetical protein
MTRPYLTVDRLGRLATTLSQRDHDILHTLQVVRVATGAQLGRLHFVDVTDRDRRHVLHHLVAKRLLARLDRQIGGARAGSAGFVYSLDIAGQRLLHHGPGAPRSPPARLAGCGGCRGHVG